MDSLSSGYDNLSRSVPKRFPSSAWAVNRVENLTHLPHLQQISIIRERTWNRSDWAGPYTPASTVAPFDASQSVDVVTAPDDNLNHTSVADATLGFFLAGSYRPHVTERLR